MKLAIAVGNNRMEKHWNQEEIEYDEFRQRLSTTHRTAETVEQYRKMKKAQQDAIKDVGGYVCGRLKEGRRKKEAILSRSAITLDMDYATPETVTWLKTHLTYACLVYSTHKSTPEQPRLRLVIPLNREVTPDEYQAVARKLAAEIGIELFDDTTYEPSRLMYWPSTSADGVFISEEVVAPFLNPDSILAQYSNWRDTSLWPVSKRQETIIQREVKKQANPLQKDGLVGAFCRTYTISEAIDLFLDDVYHKSVLSGRYDYIPADSTAGLVIYEDKFAYSHHATDPACGRLMNAFDIVRIHKFGEKDPADSEEMDPAKLPSFKAMIKFMAEDENVKETLAKERAAKAAEDFGDVTGTDWQKILTLDRNGQIKDTLSNIANIIRYDDNLKPIVFNEFKAALDVVGQLPWKQVKPGWGDADLACAKVYFEHVYGIWSPAKFKDALLAVVSAERPYHPIKEYLNNLHWDGKDRVDRLLIDYLGAEDTEYVRAVTRKTLCAAVGRIYQPGIKFDSIMVLIGPQGIGKSTLYSILGKQWYSDSLSISDMKDKTAAEKLQGYWILELGELAGIKKMDVETVKSFISRTDDKFRQAYGVNVESHPRQNIVVGSTNAESGFLRDVTGNRRFWPVHVSGKGKLHAWDLKDVDQIWAEAIDKFKAGEELFLKGSVADKAYVEQQESMEADDRQGLIEDYLERLLPDNWDRLDLYQRRSFLSGSEFGPASVQGTVKRTRVCIMEIWCECLGKERENIKRTDTFEIESILMKIGSWKKLETNSTSKIRYPLYGPQRTFIRE